MAADTVSIADGMVEGKARFVTVTISDISHRCFCLDLSANLRGDAFLRQWDVECYNPYGGFHVISADRVGWPQGFLDSPMFLKELSKAKSSRKRQRSRSSPLRHRKIG